MSEVMNVGVMNVGQSVQTYPMIKLDRNELERSASFFPILMILYLITSSAGGGREGGSTSIFSFWGCFSPFAECFELLNIPHLTTK